MRREDVATVLGSGLTAREQLLVIAHVVVVENGFTDDARNAARLDQLARTLGVSRDEATDGR